MRTSSGSAFTACSSLSKIFLATTAIGVAMTPTINKKLGTYIAAASFALACASYLISKCTKPKPEKPSTDIFNEPVSISK